MDRERTQGHATQLAKLFAGFPSGQHSKANPDIAAAYLTAIEIHSVRAVALAVSRFLRGDVPNHNKAFLPSAPQLAEQCHVQEAVVRREENPRRAIASKQPPRHELTDRERRAMQRKLELLGKQLATGLTANWSQAPSKEPS